jgi:6-phosphogluconolactonase (cycloisomerase 2 family)
LSKLVKVPIAAVAALVLLAGPAAASAMADDDGGGRGALYTQTNDPAGNTVQAFERARDGSLTPAGTFATGGAGLAGLGGRQGAVELSDDENTVYAINAGSNTVTAFRAAGGGGDDDDERWRDAPALEIAGIVASGGVAPVSVDAHRDRVYVLNSGGTPNVTAFAVDRRGTLTAIGTRDLPGALGAAQVSVTPDGGRLVVSERLSNRLETLALDRSGRPGAPVITASSGTVPFGFAFGRRGEVIVSEAGASTVSSYRADPSGALRTITPSLAVNQGAACWLAAAPNGRYAYTGNASGSISGFAVDRDGALTALNADGLTAPLIPSPRDLDFAENGRFLYAVSPGNATTGGQVTGYRVGSDGSLTQITSAPAAAGITGAAAA